MGDIKGNQKHLTNSDRVFIEQSLAEGKSFRTIAKFLEKDPTTISKEVRKYRTLHPYYKIKTNDCIKYNKCRNKKLCDEEYCFSRCAACRNVDCRTLCKEYETNHCPKLNKPPYVCNGCEDRYKSCRKPHYYYKARYAQLNYNKTLSESRKGIGKTPIELEELNELITPLIRNGQPLGHIYAHHAEEIDCSRRTLYNYLDSGLFSVRNIDLPRKVRYKPRKKIKSLERKPPDYAYKRGRTYKDFEKYIADNHEINVVEMDTVKGSNESGKVMLTMLFRNCTFMLIFLIQSGNQTCVCDVFDRLCEEIGVELFSRLFPVILTDNGSEFKNPWMLESTPNDELRTKIFYCDPQASWQKARLEKNHEFIRYIIPKGKNLQKFSQSDMIDVMNHINNTARDNLNGKTPFQLASLLLNEKLLNKLGCKHVSPDSILLKPMLLK